MSTTRRPGIPLTLGLLGVIAAILLATLVVPVLVGVGKILLVICVVILIAVGSGLFGAAARMGGRR